MQYRIERVVSIEGMRQIEDIQREVFEYPDIEIISARCMRKAQDNGGVTLAAFDNNGEIIGFDICFPGVRNNAPVWASQRIGVREKWRRKGVAYRLRKKQKDYALRIGAQRMVLVFDPLQTVNASFYFCKLGVICNKYLVNYYGKERKGIGKGMASDRLSCYWLLKKKLSPLSRREFQSELYKNILRKILFNDMINPVHAKENIFVEAIDADKLSLILPSELRMSIKNRRALVQECQIKIRRIMKELFSIGYIIVNFIPPVVTKGRCAYVFSKL